MAKFAKRHASRKPLQRFLEIVKHAEWPHFVAVKNTFPAVDYASGRLIFDIGGNKHRLIASGDFKEQILLIEAVPTHGDYCREKQ